MRSKQTDAHRVAKESPKDISGFQTFIHLFLDAVIMIDSRGRITDWNPQAERLFGWPRRQVLEKQLLSLIFPNPERNRCQREIQRVLDKENAERSVRIETCVRDRDGKEFPAELTLTPLRIPESAAVCILVRNGRPRKPEDQALQNQEQELSDFVEELTLGMFTIGTDGVVLWANRAELELLGYRRSEFIGHPLREFHVDLDVSDGILSRLAQGQPLHDYEARLRCKDGSVRHVLINSTVVRKYDRPARMRCLTRDITDYKRMEERLARQAPEARLLHRVTTLAAETHSFEEALEYSVDIVCEMTGWPVGHAFLVADSAEPALVSTNIWHLNGLGDFSALREATERVQYRPGVGLPGRIWQSREPVWVANVHNDGNFRRAELCENLGVKGAFGFPVKIRDEIVAILEFFTQEEVAPDPQLLMVVRSVGEQVGRVIERKRAQEERARLAAIVDSSYDAVIGMALDGTIRTWNVGAERLYGYTAEEAVGQTMSLLVPARLQDEGRRVLETLRCGRRLEQFETMRLRQDGREVHVSLTASPIMNANGRVIGAAAIERDITGRIRVQEDLQKAKEDAEAANRAKSEFLANISHELRTPMNAIIGMTQLALSEELPPVVRDYLETAEDSANVLLHLLNDILDFSRIESGKFHMDLTTFNLRETLDESVKTLAVRAREKDLELTCHVLNDVPDSLVGDPVRLGQVILNLVGNAIKFTETGEVAVEVRVESRISDEVSLHFTVSDTGIGISPEDQQKIFSPFTQADASTTRHFGGTGLGLAISQELISLMGGRLWVVSEEGYGSTFHFTARFSLQAESGADADGLSPLMEQLRGLPVLVVDDNAANRRLLADSLQAWHMRPEAVNDGYAALDRLRRAAAQQRTFPLVIIDAIMPGMDGFTLAEHIQEDSRLAGATVLMLSSADRGLFHRRCEELGIKAVLEKPVSQSDLLDAILTAFQGPPWPRHTIRNLGDEAGVQRPLHILLAEDTPANQKVIIAILKRRGHLVEVAQNGREAVDLFRRGQFDLVLMDVQMPMIDGFQATGIIRSMEQTARTRIPIVAMTAHVMRGDRERCLAAGMDAYLSKPIDSRKLIELVESLSYRRAENDMTQANHSTEKPKSPPSNQPAGVDRNASPRDTEPNQSEPLLDLNAALQRLGGDESLLQDIIQFFQEDSRQLLEDIRQAGREQDAEKLTRSAHSLKGLAANFNARQAVEAALTVEQLGKSGELDALPQPLDKLTQEIDALNAALSEAQQPRDK